MNSDIPELNQFIQYWDDWHQHWKTNAGEPPKGWGKAESKMGNDFPTYRYFPEPYWGNPYVRKNQLEAVFLNLNPGEGGNCQDFSSVTKEVSILQGLYEKEQSYSKTINILSQN